MFLATHCEDVGMDSIEIPAMFDTSGSHRPVLWPGFWTALFLKSKFIQHRFSRIEEVCRIEDGQINDALSTATGNGCAANVFNI